MDSDEEDDDTLVTGSGDCSDGSEWGQSEYGDQSASSSGDSNDGSEEQWAPCLWPKDVIERYLRFHDYDNICLRILESVRCQRTT